MTDSTPETPETTTETPGTEAEAEGWTTTEVAGAALKRTPRTVKNLISKGELVGRQVKRGRARPWEVEIGSLKRLRDRWVAQGLLDQAEATDDIPGGGYEELDRTEGVARAFERVAADLADKSAEAAEYRTRLQITERAESTIREELAEERRRREAAEREREDLRRELEQERSKGFWGRLFRST